MARPNNVGVGVAVFFIKDNSILLIKRKGSHFSDMWAVPGGWIDYEDGSIENAVARELLEETGVKINSWTVNFLCITTEVNKESGVRSVTLYYYVFYRGTEEPQIMEPDKCWDMIWLKLSRSSDLPKNVFPGLQEGYRAMLNKMDEIEDRKDKYR